MNSQTPARLAGSASISFQNPVYIAGFASAAGKKEGEGPLGNRFDLVCEDPMFGENTWEAAESAMQKQAAALALKKAGLEWPSQEIFWLRLPLLPLELQKSVSRFTDFSEHVPQ